MKTYCRISQLDFKFGIHQINFRNRFMQQLHCCFVSSVENHSSLPVADENYSQYCISAVLILLSLPITRILEKKWQEITSLIDLIFEKLLLDLAASLQIQNSSNKTEKLVHTGPLFLLYFLIGKLQHLASS